MALVSANVFQGSGVCYRVSRRGQSTRNCKGNGSEGQNANPLLEAPERKENLVNFGLPRDRQLFLGSERKVAETTKMWLKLRKSSHNCSNGDRVCFRFACAEKDV